MTKTYYHATPYENLYSILDEGILAGPDGLVYLTDSPENAIKFLAIRLIEDVAVIQVDLEEDQVEESFDHNEVFFDCKAYFHEGDINPDNISEVYRYKVGN